MEGKVMLLILIGTCFWCSTMSRPAASSDHQTMFLSHLKNPIDHEKIGESEVNKTKISGPSGYCMSVRDYKNGTAYIMLWYCDFYQRDIVLWTIKSDGTIRYGYNGKCLVTNENTTQGSEVMIQDCNSVTRNRTIWQFGDDGAIMNRASGLLLTSMSGETIGSLTMETDVSSPFQTWHVGNDTTPSLVSITGLQGLCLQVLDSIVSVKECVNDVEGQRWYRYPDETIRPERTTHRCLSYDNLINKRVVVLTCGLDPSSQRWVFTSNNAILNERSNLVMDVQGSDPSLDKIIVRAATGDPNQRWEITPPLSN